MVWKTLPIYEALFFPWRSHELYGMKLSFFSFDILIVFIFREISSHHGDEKNIKKHLSRDITHL